MKKKFSITATLILVMLFGTIILPSATSANTITEYSSVTQDDCMVVGQNNLPLRVRATPGGKIIGSLKIGTQIKAYDLVQDKKGNNWTNIKFKKGFGYV